MRYIMFFKGIVLASYFFVLQLSFSNANDVEDGRIDDSRMHSHLEYSHFQHLNLNKEEETSEFWNKNAEAKLQEQLARSQNLGKAKNIIFFLGDGMSIPTLAAARVYLGNKNGKPGEETELVFEKFPHVGLSKTYCVDRQVADSACTATAFLSGIKSNFGTLGVTAFAKLKDCHQMKNSSNYVYSIARAFQLDGRRTGVVTTAPVTDASPAGVYAHTTYRSWESDTNMIEDNVDPTECRDIAHQLIHGETGKNLNVVLGGGSRFFFPNTTVDEDGNRGFRSDGRNLVEEWKESKSDKSHAYVTNLPQLSNLSNKTDHVLGLFAHKYIPFNLDRNAITTPSLKELTTKAIELLSKDDKGYFLFVEGARIDTAHHFNEAKKSLDETVELHTAVEAAVNLTNSEDTLIIVTSDHSHTFSISGYPNRGNDIFGFAGKSDRDGLPYTTIGYANGLGYKPEVNGQRYDLSKDDLDDKNYQFPSMVPLGDGETHAGDDVGVFANGPWAHLVSGVLEQHVISHIMAFAACLSDYNACNL